MSRKEIMGMSSVLSLNGFLIRIKKMKNLILYRKKITQMNEILKSLEVLLTCTHIHFNLTK